MNSISSLTGHHLRTYQTLFQHPIPHQLEWHAVHSLLGRLGQLTAEPNGHLKVTRNGQVIVLHQPRTKDIGEPEEILALRHFIERSEPVPPAA